MSATLGRVVGDAAILGDAAASTRARMRVTHVVLSLNVGGAERNVINQIRLAHLLGQEASVVCIEGPGKLGFRVEEFGGTLIALNKPPGIRVEMFARLRATLRQLRPDIVHTHQVGGLFYAGYATIGLGARVVHTEHGREPYAVKARRRWLGRLSGVTVDRFFCLTHELAADAVANQIVPRRKVRQITNGIDTGRYRDQTPVTDVRAELGIAPEARVIGTVGRLAAVKRQDILIGAFAGLKKIHPDLHLMIVGDGPLLEDLKRLAANLGVLASVHFVGFQEETVSYFQAMDVFALTSDSEGTPQSVLEASVVGVPIVATCVGGIPDIVVHGSTGLLVPPGDQAAIVRALDGVLKNLATTREMTERAREYVTSRFDVERMAREYHQHYLELLS